MTAWPAPSSPCAAPAQRRLVTAKGGWTFAIAVTDQAGYPVDLTANGVTLHAEFAQPNPVRTTTCAVSLTDGPNGLAAALVPHDVVLSTLNPFPNAAFISGAQLGAPPANPFRLIVYLVDSLGSKVEGTDQIFPVVPLDPRTTDLTQIPAAQTLSIIVGPAGAQGLQGNPGAKGDPGGVAPYIGKSGTTISDGQLVALVSGVLLLASSDNAALAGTVVGMAEGGSAAGQPQAYLDTGPYTNTSWSWTPGRPIFVGAGGAMTQTPPAAGFVQRVAMATSATTIALGLGSATVIVA